MPSTKRIFQYCALAFALLLTLTNGTFGSTTPNIRPRTHHRRSDEVVAAADSDSCLLNLASQIGHDTATITYSAQMKASEAAGLVASTFGMVSQSLATGDLRDVINEQVVMLSELFGIDRQGVEMVYDVVREKAPRTTDASWFVEVGSEIRESFQSTWSALQQGGNSRNRLLHVRQFDDDEHLAHLAALNNTDVDHLAHNFGTNLAQTFLTIGLSLTSVITIFALLIGQTIGFMHTNIPGSPDSVGIFPLDYHSFVMAAILGVMPAAIAGGIEDGSLVREFREEWERLRGSWDQIRRNMGRFVRGVGEAIRKVYRDMETGRKDAGRPGSQ
ncbi:hypothetical protein HK102_005248 [Quaeritorhiza haematococci]|nr:hypothetical protein HK102_005248 [Quaeritorhiza haematococci]